MVCSNSQLEVTGFSVLLMSRLILCTITSTCRALDRAITTITFSSRAPQPNVLSIRRLALRNARTCKQLSNSGVLAEAAKLGVDPRETLVKNKDTNDPIRSDVDGESCR